MRNIFIFGIVTCVGCAMSTEMWAQTVVSSPSSRTQAAAPLDYANAKAVPGRLSNSAPSSQINSAVLQKLFSSPGFTPGADAQSGSAGKSSSVQLAPAKDLTKSASPQAGASPQQYGTAAQPFSTVRVDATLTPDHKDPTQLYSFRAIGKLFFNIGTATYLCSASLIKPGVIVTAAHCVANYGANQFYSNWQFVPAYYNGTAPYGTFTAKQALVLNKYLNGSDACYQYGVVCPMTSQSLF